MVNGVSGAVADEANGTGCGDHAPAESNGGYAGDGYNGSNDGDGVSVPIVAGGNTAAGYDGTDDDGGVSGIIPVAGDVGDEYNGDGVSDTIAADGEYGAGAEGNAGDCGRTPIVDDSLRASGTAPADGGNAVSDTTAADSGGEYAGGEYGDGASAPVATEGDTAGYSGGIPDAGGSGAAAGSQALGRRVGAWEKKGCAAEAPNLWAGICAACIAVRVPGFARRAGGGTSMLI
jgi:hypothetical protein